MRTLWHKHPGVRTGADLSAPERIADAITAFSGSLAFVYLHIAWFAAWIIFRVESYPFGLLTMIVSLEAIFLSTFVLISQNRSDQRNSERAQHDLDVDCENYTLVQANHELVKRIAEQMGIKL